MESYSLWHAISEKKMNYPPLTKDLEVDVVIVGGGITGITSALQLIQAGKKVAVLESHKIGGVTTGSSTGNLYLAVQPSYQAIETAFNLDRVKTVVNSRQLAIDYIENQVNEKKIACHFKRRPWYAYTNKSDCSFIDKELELLKKVNVDIDYTKELPLNIPYKKAIIMPNQARFNPLQYVISLAKELDSQACLIFENTRVLNIEEQSHCIVSTDQAKITAKKVIIATHSPISINLTQAFTAPYRSYVVAVTLEDNKYPEGHYWDLDKPPHALCTHPISKQSPELLMVAGSHHKTGQGPDTQSHFKELQQYLKSHFAVKEIAYQWSAQHFHAADKIPYIGLAHAHAKHTYMATGYFADGLVYGTLAGIILGDMLTNKENKMVNAYNSNRHDLMNALPFVLKENSNVLLQYLKDMPIFDNEKYKQLQKGEGCVIEWKGQKLAVSRDENNELQVVSAVCTHMKGIVNWNQAEQSWDCPCHGSRFTNQGQVIDGPATQSLWKYDSTILNEDN